MISNEVKELQQLFYQTHNYLEDNKKDGILILGIGNYLMGDEGVGVHIIHALARTKLPHGVDILDGGTGSFDLMPVLARFSRALFIDATMDGQPPGTVRVLYPHFAKDFPAVLSAHDVGLKDMIEALEFKNELPRIILVTISIRSVQPMSIELTDPVKASVPEAVLCILDILKKANFYPHDAEVSKNKGNREF